MGLVTVRTPTAPAAALAPALAPAAAPGAARLPGGLGPALVAAAAALVCYFAGWRGTDWAAELYRAGEVARHGLTVWDPGWYGGTLPLAYSLLLPPAGALFGLWPLTVVSAAAAAFCFDRLISPKRGWPPLASWYFAVSTVIAVAIGQLPTLAGEALALGCILCAVPGGRPNRRGARRLAACALGLGAALTTPVAGAFLAISFAAWGLVDLATPGRRHGGAHKLLAATALLAATVFLPLVFGQAGYFPFPYGDLLAVLGVCTYLALPWVPKTVRAGAVLYALATLAVFVVPNDLGDNDARFAAYIGVPLVIFYLPAACRMLRAELVSRDLPALVSRGLGVLALASSVLWEWSPIAEAVQGTVTGPASLLSFYRPVLEELGNLSNGLPTRVEVPPLAGHWEAVYIAPEFPLARGWERQLDMAYNPLFYQAGPLPGRAYKQWLVADGVSYVALANARLDYAAESEAKLLHEGDVPGLVPVWRDPKWELWRVEGPGAEVTALARWPAVVTSLAPDRVVVRFYKPGASILKIRWANEWSLGTSEASWVCAGPSGGGWTEVSASKAGNVVLTISLFGPDHGTQCPSPARPAHVPSR
ncbi:MAG TPA: hypothetical protein VL984_05695 [Acidimicrobiales bacterium]|nr:hypothetical protein [Acidimicrobiales bacterium]